MRLFTLASAFVALNLLDAAVPSVIPHIDGDNNPIVVTRSPSSASHLPKTNEPRGWLKNPFKGKKGPGSSSQPPPPASDSDNDFDSEQPPSPTAAENGRVPDIQERGYVYRAVRNGGDVITVEVGLTNPSSSSMTVINKFEIHPSEYELKVINAENAEKDHTPAPRKARFRTILMAAWKEYSEKYVSELKYITYSHIINPPAMEAIKQAYLWMGRNMDNPGTDQLVVDREEDGTDERRAFNWLVNQNPLGRVVAGIPSTFSAMNDKQIDRVVVWAKDAEWAPPHLASQFRSWHIRFRYRDT